MYDRGSLREIWLQWVYSSISSLRFAEQEHVACQYARIILYWSLALICREYQKDCIILLAAQAQCTELLK